MSERHKLIDVEETIMLARDFVMARNSTRKISDGWARLDEDGLWRVWFERLDQPIMDPIHTVVSVDPDTGKCTLVPMI